MKATTGIVLRVDLGARSIREDEVPEDIRRDCAGGIALAARLLFDAIPAGADPLGPDNALCFAPGVLSGTGALMCGRWSVSCKSPLTGGWGDANCGGTLAPALKRRGWDAVIFTGIAREPTVFVADDAGPRLEPAGELWGMDALDAEAALGARLGGKPAIAAIGTAAEKLSLISGISNDSGRYAARSGVGAVMGSKRLKALALSGGKAPECADQPRVNALSRSFAEKVARQSVPGLLTGKRLSLVGRLLGARTAYPVDGMMSAGVLKKWGTAFNNVAGAVNGDSPMGNWGKSVRDYGRRWRSLDPDRLLAREVRKYRCHSCAIGCGGLVDATGVLPSGGHVHKPEYETCCAFGPLCLADDLDAILRINDLCNRAGLDTISAGGAVAFAIECFEEGILTAEDTGGLELRFGNSAAIEALVALMARREGFGDILADGVARAAERIGRGSERFAIHYGGQEPGMHDPRFDPLMGVAFAADPTPGRHTIASSSYYNASGIWEFVPWAPKAAKPYPKRDEYRASEREAAKALAMVCLKQVLDMAGGCLFALLTGLRNWRLFEFLDAATGEPRTPAEWMELGRRAQATRAAFSAKHGVSPRGAATPPRLAGRPPLARGPLAGRSVPIEAMVENYLDLLESGPAVPDARGEA